MQLKLTTGPEPSTPLGVYTSSTTDYEIAGYSLSRGDILTGKVPVYWGPAQQPVQDYSQYDSPAYWPAEGILPRIPNVCRLIWEDADLDGEAYAIAGFSGEYTYGIHTVIYDFDNISSKPTVVYSSGVHVSYPFPQFSDGIPCYATPFHSVFAGYKDYGDFSLTVTGGSTDWFLYDFLTPPFSLNDFRNPVGQTYLLINEAWLLLLNGFSPSGPDPGNEFTAPPFISHTPDGPFNVGCSVYKTGRYSVDGLIYSDGTDIEIPPQSQTIRVGFDAPVFVDITQRYGNMVAAVNILEALYYTSSYPYFDAYEKQGYQNDDFLAPVTPTTNSYVSTNTLNILVLAKPRRMPDSSITDIIKAQYTGMSSVVIYVETQWMLDCNIPASIVANFTGAIQGLCDDLKDYGFSFGGDPNLNHDTNGVAFTASIINNINKRFPRDHPPSSIDPPRTDHGTTSGDPSGFSHSFTSL